MAKSPAARKPAAKSAAADPRPGTQAPDDPKPDTQAPADSQPSSPEAAAPAAAADLASEIDALGVIAPKAKAEFRALMESIEGTEVHGVAFPITSTEVFASRDYPDRVVVVTTDGRKLIQPKQAAQ